MSLAPSPNPSDKSRRPRKYFIDLSSTTIDETALQYEKLLALNSDPSVQLCILDVPYYSVSLWNLKKGHSNSDVYLETE